jgi:hypothetical protein
MTTIPLCNRTKKKAISRHKQLFDNTLVNFIENKIKLLCKTQKKKEDQQEKDFPGYPHYSKEEDIYAQEDKVLDERVGQVAQDETDEQQLGANLDVPGAELDDDQEKIGSEDEENNYYSLGGENHEDLEQGEDF